MGLPNGQGAHLREVFLDRLLPCNPMEPSVAPLIAHSIPKNADRSTMALCGSCMLGALDIVVSALSGRNVKQALPPKNLDG
jgi:hypothetical protein